MKYFRTSKTVRVVAVAAVVALIAGGWLLYGMERAHRAGVEISTLAPATAQVIDQTQISAAAKKALPSVVAVASTKVVQSDPGMNPFFNDPFFRRFFGEGPEWQREQVQRGLGSGVIVSADGYILTNAHVVAQADEIKVQLPDKRELVAEVKGADKDSDVALLKIDASNLPALPFADSDRAEVGDIVLAIGSPFGLGSTVTMGIISAKGRADLGILGQSGYEDFIQTDAAINPGNSGGALINLRGEVVGINTAIFSRTGGYQGIGFAIPSNLARRVMESLGKHGEFVRGYLGVGLQPVTPELAEQFSLKDRNGVLISYVEPDGPAAKAGVTVGDVLFKVNGREVDSPGAVKSIIGIAEPGAAVSLELLRDGKPQTVEATLTKAPDDLAAEPAPETSSDGGAEILSGLWASDITAQLRDRMELPREARGVVVLRLDQTKLQSSMPLETGDLIVAINRMRVGTLQQAQQLIKETQRDSVLLLVQRGRYTTFTTVKK